MMAMLPTRTIFTLPLPADGRMGAGFKEPPNFCTIDASCVGLSQALEE